MTESHPPHTGYSEAIEDFLKAVYILQQEQDRVHTSMLADMLKISAPSISEMAKKLAKANLVKHEPYRGITLTDAGERVALAIVRHHRLLELFLVEALHYSWDEVHDEADHLEHAISERLAERIADYLGHPRYDPHGDPIPSPQGDISPRALTPLSRWELFQAGIVERLADQSPDMLRYLAEKGLIVGALVEVTAVDPFDGPLTLLVNGREQVIGPSVAGIVLVGPQKLED